MKPCLFTLVALLSFFASTAQADGLVDVLKKRLVEDVDMLASAIRAKDARSVWEASTKETQERMPFDAFLSSLSPRGFQDITNVRLLEVVDYCIYGGTAGQKLMEAYAVVELSFESKRGNYREQSIWVFGVDDGHWRFRGVPFRFAFAPMGLRYPGIPDTSCSRSSRAVPESGTEARPD
jgi:hypothetical protein